MIEVNLVLLVVAAVIVAVIFVAGVFTISVLANLLEKARGQVRRLEDCQLDKNTVYAVDGILEPLKKDITAAVLPILLSHSLNADPKYAQNAELEKALEKAKTRLSQA